MVKFPWGHSHQKEPSDKFIPSTEWFSKSTAEPSREALTNLVKERVSAEFDDPLVPSAARTRPRTNTASSLKSYYTKASSDRSAEVKSRPQSRQGVVEDVPPSPTRHEPVSRNLFSRGSRIIRRRTSKLTLMPSQTEEMPRHDLRHDGDGSRLDLASQLLSFSPRRTPSSKPAISGPFDFQHVTHTGQDQFQSLDSATKTEIASEFHALQAGHQPTTEIIGIAVDDLPGTSPVDNDPQYHQPASPISSFLPNLPITPPRPFPPPKDLPLAFTPTNIRLSRSVENFSRPTRSPAVGGDISPISELNAESVWPSAPVLPVTPPSPLSWAEATNGTLSSLTSSRRHSQGFEPVLDKPLPPPPPPALIHAVSTDDDSAVPWKTAPLPQLPSIPVSDPNEDLNVSIPHLNSDQISVTSPRASLRHMQTFPSAKTARRRSQSSGEMTLGNSVSAFSLLPATTPIKPKHTRQPSIGIKKIDIEDWEDAIDYSWEHPLDSDDPRPVFDLVEPVNPTLTRQPPPPSNIHEYTNRPMPLTPVMEQQLEDQSAEELQSPTRGHNDPVIASLQGLGIDTCRSMSTVQVEAEVTTDGAHKPDSPRIPAIRRERNSSISKSSSQESIILSIASSIMSTQRSSNSSTSLSDVSNLTSFEGEPGPATHDVMDRTESREDNFSDDSQDTVTTEPQSVTTPATDIPSPAAKHERGVSMPKVNVPNRTSSIAAPKSTAATRQRSNTLNGRPRNVRVSYSLFPAPRSQVPPTPTSVS